MSFLDTEIENLLNNAPHSMLIKSALDIGKCYHSGLRKDGVTPEFMHQIQMSTWINNIEFDTQDKIRAIVLAIIHDLWEDKKDEVDWEHFKEVFPEYLVQSMVLLSKYDGNGNKMSDAEYYANIEDSDDPIDIFVKGIDQLHNVRTMQGVFSEEKQRKYTNKIQTYVIPMLLRAEIKFPTKYRVLFNYCVVGLKSHINEISKTWEN